MARQLHIYTEYEKQAVVFIGTATDDGIYGKQYQTTFGLDHIRIVSPQQIDVPGRITVSGFGANAVYRGDMIQISGKLRLTRGTNQAAVSFAQLRVIGRNMSPIDTFRRKFAAGMQSALPEPAASFGMGILIGQRSTLPPEVTESLLVVGLTHIIAVSGYNLTIIVEAARRLFEKRSKYQMTVTCAALILVFILITGNSPSIVRASIISMLSITAWYFGRTINALVLLLSAAAITVIANPLYLWGNVSWYLSFLAFFGVVVLGPLITWKLYKSKKPGLIMQVLLESICAEIMTLPYILYIFGQMSNVSLLANVLVVALVPLAMLLCLVAGLAGMLLPVMAGWFAWPARLLLTYMLDAANLLSRVPHAFAEGVGFSFVQLLGWYMVVGMWIAIVHYKKEREYGTITEKIGLETEGK
jgi:competence protein ComEC